VIDWPLVEIALVATLVASVVEMIGSHLAAWLRASNNPTQAPGKVSDVALAPQQTRPPFRGLHHGII
jgi:hypothetical protein